MSAQPKDEILFPDEAAELLRVKRGHLYSLARRKKIPHWRVGKFLRFSKNALKEWAEKNGSTGEQADTEKTDRQEALADVLSFPRQSA